MPGLSPAGPLQLESRSDAPRRSAPWNFRRPAPARLRGAAPRPRVRPDRRTQELSVGRSALPAPWCLGGPRGSELRHRPGSSTACL
eukprot:7734983-Lingulodinium_polyedra.AAC.1